MTPITFDNLQIFNDRLQRQTLKKKHWLRQFFTQKCTQPQDVQDVEEFICSSEQIWRNLLWAVWRHPFTAEDPLMSKWCDAKFLQISSNEETNSSTSWMAWGWVHFQQILTLGWTVPLRKLNRVSFDFMSTFCTLVKGYWPEYLCVLELCLSVDWSSRLEIRDASLAVLVKLRSDRVWSVWGVWVTLWDTLSDSYTDEPCCCLLLCTDLWGKIQQVNYKLVSMHF